MKRAIDVGVHVPHAAVRAYVLGERCNTDYVPNADEIAEMAALVREGVEAGALGFSTSRTLLHKDLKGVHMPGTFAGSDEMLALGMAMKGLKHGVFEMVSDHLGDDDEWKWVKGFAHETGLPVTLVATSAGAYEGDKMYNIAEEARAEGMDIRPQIAGRPTGILQGLHLQLPRLRRPPDLPARDRPPAAGREGRDDAAAGDPRGAAGRGERHARRRRWRDPTELLYRVFPLGDSPNYEPDRERQRRRPGRGRRRDADGDDVRPADPRRRARAVLPAARRLLHLQLRLLPQEHAAPERAVRPLRRRRPLRRHRRRRHADLHPHPLGARPHQGRAVPAGVPGAQADQRHRAWPTA